MTTPPNLEAGARWLARQTAAQRKTLGQWATPWWVVDRAVHWLAAGIEPGHRVVDPACGDGRWLVAVARHCPDAELIGVDIDPGALTAARATLDRAGVDAELHQGDGLTGDTWPHADWVIGNPPYVRPQNLPPATRKSLWSRFESATDKVDLYAFFVERALERAEHVALLIPDTWMHMASFAAARGLVHDRVHHVLALPERVFPDATVRAVLLHAGPEPTSPRAGRLSPEGVEDDGPLHRGPHAWTLDGAPPELSGTPLSSLVTIHMGVVCGDYARYVHLGREHPADEPTCRGRDVQRWSITDRDEYIRYLPREMLDRKPYVAPKSRELFDVDEKIVVAGASGTRIRAAMDTDRRFPLDSCYVIQGRPGTDLWAILGLLNSSRVSAWYGARHRAARVKGVELKRIPIPDQGLDAIAEAARAADDIALDLAVDAAYA